jgi:hypothetical protein
MNLANQSKDYSSLLRFLFNPQRHLLEPMPTKVQFLNQHQTTEKKHLILISVMPNFGNCRTSAYRSCDTARRPRPFTRLF